MALPVLVALAAVGIVAGFVSGLVGVGGGVLIVPFLYFFYAHPAWAGEAIASPLEASIAHATSLFIIVPTAVLGTIAYSRAKLVAWRAAVPIALVSIVSATLGAKVALQLPADVLKLAFGCFLLFTAWQLIGRKTRTTTGPLRLGLAVTVPCGLVVGLLSAMLGVGGGIVAIPLLIHVIRLDVQRVAATSLAVVTVAATAGTLTYIASGWNDPRLPAGSLGYVHATAAVPMLLGSMLSVRLGTWTNQQLDARTLRWVFGLLFLALGLRLIVQSIIKWQLTGS